MPVQKRMTLRQQETQAKANCFDWNAKHPAGTPVSYEEIFGRGETHRTKTSGEAFVSSGEAVVFIEGVSGYVSLEHCTVVDSVPVVPVQKITLADRGQDFLEWYVRDGIVIDCRPHQGSTWVGTKLVLDEGNPLAPGSTIYMHLPATGKTTNLNYPVESIETLSPAEAEQVVGYAHKWAEMKGVTPESLGLNNALLSAAEGAVIK